MADHTVNPVMHSAVKNLIGRVFGRLTVIEPTIFRTIGGNLIWKCRCTCGTETVVSSGRLTNGRTKSCGCLFRERTTHGACRRRAHTREYSSWAMMRDRCNNPRNRAYDSYGGRGIVVCARWDSFAAFLADMGPRPLKHDLERIDNERGYSPDNCRWATRHEQMRNTRRNRMITFNGETLCLKDWAVRFGVPSYVIGYRLTRGWSVEEALTRPTKR